MEVDPTPALRVPNVCRWCGQVGHQRRSSRLCTYRIIRRPRNTETSNNSTENPVNNNSESTAPSEAVSEPVIGEPDATTTENTDDLPDISESINNGGRMGADSRVTCPYCGREVHVRNTHSNCAMNASRQSTRSQNTHNCARGADYVEVERNNVGEMSVECTECGAYMWMMERKTRSSDINPKFQLCCADSRAISVPLRPVPEVLAALLCGNSEECEEFRTNIRTFNSALSFTSMNAELDHQYTNSRGGAYSFRIHGTVHHLISSSLTPDSSDIVNEYTSIFNNKTILAFARWCSNNKTIFLRAKENRSASKRRRELYVMNDIYYGNITLLSLNIG